MGNEQSLDDEQSSQSSDDEQSLHDCEWKFEEPCHSFLYDKSVHLINNKTTAKIICNRLRKERVLYVDCEGNIFGNRDSKIGIIQIATDSNNCYIFDVFQRKECLTILKHVFESSDIHKVFHDCSGDVAALAVAGIQVQNVGDTQIGQHFVENPMVGADRNQMQKYSLAGLYNNITGKIFPKINVPSYGGDNKWLDERPLTNKMGQYAAVDALVLPEIYNIQNCYITGDLICEYKSMIEQSISYKCKKIGIERSTDTQETASSRAAVAGSVGALIGVAAFAAGAYALYKHTEQRSREREEEEQRRRR